MAQEAKHAESAKENPLAKYLEVPGAKTTLPVSAAKKPFPLDFVNDARAKFESFHYQMGGDHALYYNGHLSEMMPTALSQPIETYRPLEVALNSKIGMQVTFAVKEGELTLDEYVVHPNHRVQGVMMIHKGKIVYQQYPGMNPTDVHVWMSAAKSTVGLVIAQMEDEGKIDMQKSVADYVPELKGTSWDGIKMIDAMILQNLTPDDTAVAHGLLSSTLEDFARYGMLYTPSWDKVAFEPVVSAEVLKRIQTAGNPPAYRAAYPEGAEQGPGAYFGEAPLANSFQFDAVFEDGALWKHGNLGQGVYIDPKRDFVGVYFSTNGYVLPYGEDKMADRPKEIQRSPITTFENGFTLEQSKKIANDCRQRPATRIYPPGGKEPCGQMRT